MKTLKALIGFLIWTAPVVGEMTTAPVSTQQGSVIGYLLGQTKVFKGIPFAASPTGKLRFSPPVSPPPRAAALLATRDPAECAQPSVNQDGSIVVIGSEDCLKLNIWTPAGATAGSNLPVMVFIHGGGYLVGSSTDDIYHIRTYDGRLVSERAGIVVVTIQYRLGALGYMAHPSFPAGTGNFGLLDQVEALAWVSKNIRNFGGDPSRVTLFGQSAGGGSVRAVLATSRSQGLVQRAILESGPDLYHTLQQSLEFGTKLSSILGCEEIPSSEALKCLRSKSASDFVIQQFNSTPDNFVPKLINLGVPIEYLPTVDGNILKTMPTEALRGGMSAGVTILVGSTSEEATNNIPTKFSSPVVIDQLRLDLGEKTTNEALSRYATLYPNAREGWQYTPLDYQVMKIVTDYGGFCHQQATAKATERNGVNVRTAPAYRYEFNYLTPIGDTIQSAFHGVELLYVFQTLGKIPVLPTPDSLKVERNMLEYWTSFAKTGVPSATGAARAIPYSSAEDNILLLNANSSNQSHYRSEICALFGS
jgi:para-nitrobenzyl esterase